MSVWDIPYHLDDPLNHAVARIKRDPLPLGFLRQLAQFDISHVEGFELPVPDGRLADNLPERHFLLRRVWPDAGDRFDKQWHHTVWHYENCGAEVRCGLRSVYDLCYHAYHQAYDEQPEIPFGDVLNFAAKLVANMYTAGHAAPATRNKAAKVAKGILRRVPKARYLFQVGAAFDHMLSIANASEYSESARWHASRALPAPATRSVSMDRPVDLGPEFLVRVAGGAVFIEEPIDVGKGAKHGWRVHYLTMKDVRRVCETINGMAQTLLYPSLAKAADPSYDRSNAIRHVLEHIVSSMRDAPDPNNVARFYDVALHTYIARLATDLSSRPLEEMKAKYEKEALHRVADMGQYLRLFQNLDPQEALDAARVYKLLPCPDFNPFTDFAVQAGKQADKNPWFPGLCPGTDESSFEEWRHLQAVRLAVEHTDALGAPRVDAQGLVDELGPEDAQDVSDAIVGGRAKDIPLRAARHLDVEGLLPMLGLDPIVPETLKDKSLCPAGVSGRPGDPIDASGTAYESNYLLEHMRTPMPITAQEALTRVANSTMLHYHKVFFKPETKKANARNCYSAQSLARKALSLVEQSVAHYLRDRRGNANGKPDYAIVNSVLEAHQGYEGRILGVSFDISGFSPNMALEATRSSLRKWANLFGDPRVGEAHRVLTQGVAVWNHGFIMQSYALRGTDLEGYFGRVNTDYHIDVMTYALHVLQARMLADPGDAVRKWGSFKAHLQVMIDDGLLLLKWDAGMPPVSEMPAEVLDFICGTIEGVYGECSMKLSWDKTVVSGRCMTFLNEVFLDGRHIGNGLRAYVRIRPERGVVPMDAHELANRYVAMAQGAIKSGASMLACTVALGLQLGMEFARNRGMPVKWGSDLADLLFLPTAYGGGALPSTTLLGASAGGDPYIVALGNCIRIGDEDPRFGGKVLHYADMEPVEASPLQTLRNPIGVHVGAKQLTCTALKDAIGKRLAKVVRNVELRVLLRIDLMAEAEMLLSSIGGVVTDQLLGRVYSSSRIHLVDRLLDKFKKASSLAGILTRRAIRRIERANSRALLAALAQYRSAL